MEHWLCVYVYLILLSRRQTTACPDRLRPDGGRLCCFFVRDVTFMQQDMHPQSNISENCSNLPLGCRKYKSDSDLFSEVWDTRTGCQMARVDVAICWLS